MSARAALAVIACAVVLALIGAGCTSISLRGTEARAPILLGPVACIDCAPQPGPGAAAPTVAAGIREREVGFAFVLTYADSVTHETEPLDVVATRAVSDPCREELHVTGIHTGTWAFDVPLLFNYGKTWVDVQASRTDVPNGTCGSAPLPSSGPAGIVGAAAEKPRDRRRMP